MGLLQTCDDSALFKRVVRDVFEPIVNAAVSAQAEDGSGDSDDGSDNDGAASNDAAFAKLSLPQLYGRLQVVARSPKTIERQRAKAYVVVVVVVAVLVVVVVAVLGWRCATWPDLTHHTTA